MATESVNIKVQVDAGDGVKNVGNIRRELKEANAELIAAQREFGQYSKEAVAAAKRVAELRDAVADAREAADLFDPGKKFQAFSAVINSVAGGFAAVQGALGLVGVESEEVEKQLLKVQSALALSQGLNEITDAAPKFAGLAATIRTKVVTAFSTLKGAIAATGIGALVVGIGLLIANFDQVVAAIRKVIPGFDNFVNGIRRAINAVTDFIGITSEAERQLDKLNAASKTRSEQIEREIKVLSAQGGKEAEIYGKRRQLIQEEIEQLNRRQAAGQQLNEKELKQKLDLLADQRALDLAEDKRLKDQSDARNKQASDAAKQRLQQEQAAAKQLAQARAQAEKAAEEQIRSIRTELALAGIKDEFDKRRAQIEQESAREIDKVRETENLKAETRAALIKAIEEKRAADLAEIAEAERTKQLEAEREFQAQLEELKSSIQLAGIEDRNERELASIVANYEKQRAAIDEQENLTAEQKLALKLLLQEKEAQELESKQNEINLGAADKELARLQKQASDITLGFEFRKQVLQDEAALLDQYYADGILSDDEFTKRKAENADRQIQIDRLKTQAQLDNAAKVSDLLGSLSDLFGKQTAAGKVAAIAQATIDTYLAAVKAYQSLAGIPVVGPALGAAAAGVAVAAGIKNIKAITAVPAPGAAPATPAISNATAPLAPALPLTQTVTQLQSGTINQLQSATTRAYVVESDVTGAQERIRRLNRAARLG